MKNNLQTFITEIDSLIKKHKKIDDKFDSIDEDIELFMSWEFKLEERDSKLILITSIDSERTWFEQEWPGTKDDYELFLKNLESFGVYLPEIIMWCIQVIKEKHKGLE